MKTHPNRRNVQSLKSGLGAHKEALEIFKEYVHSVEKKYKEDKKYGDNYRMALSALGYSYGKNDRNDLAAMVRKKGFEIA